MTKEREIGDRLVAGSDSSIDDIPIVDDENRYAGESAGKKQARFESYLRISDLFMEFGRPKGMAIALCGPHAADWPLMTSMLRWPPDEIIMCDLDTEYIRAANSNGSVGDGTILACADIRECLRSIVERGGKFGFVSLDFCGHVGSIATECLQIIGPHLSDGGVVALTFFRGREKETSDYKFRKTIARHTLRISEKKKLKRSQQLGEDCRFAAVYNAFALNLGIHPGLIRAVDSQIYQSTSPMGLIAVQKAPAFPHRGEARRYHAFVDRTHYVRLKLRNSDEDLREKVVAYRRIIGEMPPKWYARLWNLSPRQIAAWLAVDTMKRT